MLNKIQKGKRALITIGVILIVFSVLASIGAVVCTINAIDRWWMMAIAAVLYLLGILGLIVGITFVWTACAMKATTGNLKEGNIPLEAGTINAIKCPNCGSDIQPQDKFCPKCGKDTSGQKVCANCKAVNTQDAKVCTQCGKDL